MREGHSGGDSVVVIDDFKDAADALALLLEIEGLDVHVAYDGQSGLRLIQDLHPDVAIIDLVMPGLDGGDVAKAVRMSPWGAHMHLIALTGLAIPEGSRDILSLGFNQCLIKPAYVDALIAAVR